MFVIRREPSAPLTENKRCAAAGANFNAVAKRLETQDPGCTARAQAEQERRLKATLAALEREQATREAD